MTEVAMWDKLRPLLQSRDLDPHRVENGIGVGTPDVNYSDGWMELKDLDGWPQDPERPVLIPKLIERKGQVAWLLRRWHVYGAAFLMLRVGRELLLFDGWTTREVKNGRPREWLRQHACWRSLPTGQITPELMETLVQWLTLDGDAMEARDRARLNRLLSRTTIDELAAVLDLLPEDVLSAELHGDTPLVDDLLAHWEN